MGPNPWEFIGPTIGISVVAMSIASVFIFRGALGRAIAERIAGRGPVPDGEIKQLHAELDEVRVELAAVQERLDFAERLLAKQREPERLRP